MAETLKQYMLLGFQKGIDLGLSQGSGYNPPGAFATAVRKSIERQAFEKASLITDTTEETLKGLLQQAVDGGWGSAKLAKALRDEFDQMSVVRSKLIARTELTGVINQGTLAALQDEGQTYKQWSTVMDGRERETHAAANGQVVPIDGLFTVGGSQAQAPGDANLPVSELAQCRCTIVAANTPEGRRLKLYDMFIRIHGSLEVRFVLALRREFDQQRRRVLSRLPS
jgi:SPP1 gp7 family putative phage head morphogenesis protein